ncbi:MAG: methyltransferase [Chloroflexi bacterium]|jgi:predicted O-methyltransferase YrrM|nr:methyltransferase [Chloroflexota bacterium]
MFWDIPQSILERMAYLEEIDSRDREDGTPQVKRLRQVVPETGRFLALMAANALHGHWLEVGTSGGYSGLWLSLACRLRGHPLVTFEISDYKFQLAQETFKSAGVDEWIIQVGGDALQHLAQYRPISFCFIDAEKDLYQPCFEQVLPNMVSGGLFLADNTISHQQALQPFLDFVANERRVDSMIVPIGKGVLLCRKD